ncbi:hypothetical protein EJB05_31129, partial [Eragrostis curvula]
HEPTKPVQSRVFLHREVRYPRGKSRVHAAPASLGSGESRGKSPHISRHFVPIHHKDESGGGTEPHQTIQIPTLTMATADESAAAMEQDEEETTEVLKQVGEESAGPMEQVGEDSIEPMELIGEKPTEATEQVGEVPEEADAEEEAAGASLAPALPLGRVKRIIRVDRDIKKGPHRRVAARPAHGARRPCPGCRPRSPAHRRFPPRLPAGRRGGPPRPH